MPSCSHVLVWLFESPYRYRCLKCRRKLKICSGVLLTDEEQRKWWNKHGQRRNKRLIAAALEMYEALVAIESCLAPDDNDYAAQKVRVAIHKVEGADKWKAYLCWESQRLKRHW